MPDGGQLVLKSHVANHEWIVVSISDTGVGIAEENKDKIFEPLFTSKAKGLGLGLAIIKIMVEAHGGVIEVESEHGKGSNFKVKLPIDND
jgi:signal transduction histidine kinase